MMFILQPFGIPSCQCLSRFAGYVGFEALMRCPEALKLSVKISPSPRASGILIISGSSDLTKVRFLTFPTVVLLTESICWLKREI